LWRNGWVDPVKSFTDDAALRQELAHNYRAVFKATRAAALAE